MEFCVGAVHSSRDGLSIPMIVTVRLEYDILSGTFDILQGLKR